MFEKKLSIPEKDKMHMPLSNGKTMWYSFLEPPSFINIGEHGERKLTLLSEVLSLFRIKKFFNFEILAPGTIKENTRDCYFLKDIIWAEEKVELCYKEDRTLIRHRLFYFNPQGWYTG
ncbi:hypothetical protein ACSAZL_11240 [Methanosarcina sp. T3]|uniref:hypothetical protein n=1 Tax=Methanosarcina sp. T3 TaxID=3439062 RepID=UPI003F82DA93